MSNKGWLGSTKKQTIQQRFGQLIKKQKTKQNKNKKLILRSVKLPSLKTFYTLKFHNCTIFFSSPNDFLSYRPNNSPDFFLGLLLLFLLFLFLMFFLLLLTNIHVMHCCTTQMSGSTVGQTLGESHVSTAGVTSRRQPEASEQSQPQPIRTILKLTEV